MASSDLDAAIRQRLDTLTQQRAHRAEQAKPAKTGRAARGGDDPPPPDPARPLWGRTSPDLLPAACLPQFTCNVGNLTETAREVEVV